MDNNYNYNNDTWNLLDFHNKSIAWPDYSNNLDYSWDLPEFPDQTNHLKYKCCPERKILDQLAGDWKCVQHDTKFEDVINIFKKLSDDPDKSFHVESVEDSFNTLCESDADILIWSPNSIDFFDHSARSDDYEEFFQCIDVAQNMHNTLTPMVVSCVSKESSQYEICPTEETERIFHLVFGFLSIIFITLALLVYVLLPKQLLNIHGKVVVGNFISCLMFLVFLMITFSTCWTLWPLPGTLSCKILGYFGYYSTMAMFAWMLSLCLDLFCTFFQKSGSATSSRFFMYCSIGWGLPILFLFFLILFDHIILVEMIHPPHVGFQSCFIHEDSRNLFLNIPIFIFMIINTIMYASTVFFIYKTTKSIRKSVKQDKMKENLIIFAKLFLVMGILWAFEILSQLVDNSMFSLFFGILNISRGSFMFIIFILKTSVINGLKNLVQSKSNQDPIASEYSSRWGRSKKNRRKTETSLCVTEL